VDVRGRARRVAPTPDRQEADSLRRWHHHSHRRRKLLNSLIVAEGCDAFAQRRIAGGERRVELE
jgi:hypothetical protein